MPIAMIYEVGERTDDRILPHQAREEYGASVMDGGDNIMVVTVVTCCNAWTSGNVAMAYARYINAALHAHFPPLSPI